MSVINDLEGYYALLESKRATERKKAYDVMAELLDKDECLEAIGTRHPVSWSELLESCQRSLRLEVDKLAEDNKKKGSCNDVQFQLCKKLFVKVVKQSALGMFGDDQLNIPSLVTYIDGSLRERAMKKYCESTFLGLLRDTILNSEKCFGQLDEEHWLMLFGTLKKLLEEKTTTTVNELMKFTCFKLLIKYGPLCSFPVPFLREQFLFVEQLCKSVSQSSPVSQQEDVIEMILEFCKHTVEDNRVSCIRLGENIFTSLLDLYEFNAQTSPTKVDLVEFMLLQVTIHNPNGVSEGHPSAYACSWVHWKSCLRKMYILLSKEVDMYFKNGNSSFFKKQEILDCFVLLFVEVVKQLVTESESVTIDITCNASMASQPNKKQKIEVSLDALITKVKATKSWVWIDLMGSLIATYPSIIDEELFFTLLHILHTFLVDIENSAIMDNICDCLTKMLGIQKHLEITERQLEIDKLWKQVFEVTLRAVGLNQNSSAVHRLQQTLILNGNYIDLDLVLETYISEVKHFNTDCIESLKIVFQEMVFSQIENDKKQTLMDKIFNKTEQMNFTLFCHPNTAQFLVALNLKQWPFEKISVTSNHIVDKYKDVKEIQLKTIFEMDFFEVKKHDNNRNVVDRTYNIDAFLLEYFFQKVKNFSTDVDDLGVTNILSIVCFLSNVLGYMVEYKIITDSELNDCDILCMIRGLLNKENNLETLKKYKDLKEKKIKPFLECLNILDQLFSIKSGVMYVVKGLIPAEILRLLVEVLNFVQNENKRKHHQVKKTITKVLSSFSCITNGVKLNTYQQKVMGSLSNPDYNYSNDDDYTLSVTFLTQLKDTDPEFLPTEVLSNVINCILKMAAVRYRRFESAKVILAILYELYPLVAKSEDQKCKETAVSLLRPFFSNRNIYGRDILLGILKCMEQICKVDPKCEFSIWDGQPIVKQIPLFLVSDYQIVRFKAIETLVTFFDVTTVSTSSIADFHKQEELFSSMYEMSLKVFKVEGKLTDERRTDEILSRTASAVYTFSTFMLHFDNWIEDSLIALMKLEHHKALGCTDKVLSLLRKHFSSKYRKNLLQNCLENIIRKWLNEGYSINHFQFTFFGCKNKFEFYSKHIDTCLPLLIDTDKDDLLTVARQLSMSEKEVLERCCTNVISQILCDQIDNGIENISKSKKMAYLNELVGEANVKKTLVEKLDDLILRLLYVITDENHIQKLLGDTFVILKRGISYRQFLSLLKFVEGYLCSGMNIMEFLSEKHLGKAEKIMLAIRLQIYNSIGHDKIKFVYQYAIFLNLLLGNVKDGSKFLSFLIRITIYSLINLIQTHISDNRTSLSVLKMFNLFIKKVLPNYVQFFEPFFLFTVNALKNIALSNSALLKICIEILQFIIVENVACLGNEIEKLDEFPQISSFERIRTVCRSIKYQSNKVTLEKEIQYFLENTDMVTRQDSLIHLRKILLKEKKQLQSMNEKLKELRGFSEDCEESLLHRLVSRLINMTISANQEVSIEARKCLGEIGPLNLTTLVLLPERKRLNIDCSSYELLTAQVLSMLSNYIIDRDIEVSIKASEALYMVLGFREGIKIADKCSRTDFGNGLIPNSYILPFYHASKKISIPSNTTINVETFSEVIDNTDIWSPSAETISHSEWITNLVSCLLKVFDKCFLPNLVPVCKVKVKFCENLLQYIIYLLLSTNKPIIVRVLSTRINEFFANHWDLTTRDATSENQNLIMVNKKSVKCMLDVINFVKQQKEFGITCFKQLNFNFLPIAKAAEFCSAHFAALLYAELWCQDKIEDIADGQNQFETLENGYTLFDVIYENESELVGKTLYNILTNAYKAIGDLDALAGCGMSYLLQPRSRVEYYKILGKSVDVLHYYNTELLHGSDLAKQGVIDSLKANNLYHLPILCSSLSEEPQYECMWRLGQWKTNNKNLDLQVTEKCADYEKYKFYALKALLCDKDEYSFQNLIKSMGTCVVNSLKHISLDCCTNIYPTLVQLESLIEMENFAEAVKTANFTDLLATWKLQDRIIRKNDFQYAEPIAAQRFTMISEYSKLEGALKKSVPEITLDFAEYAKENGQFVIAMNLIHRLQFLSGLDENVQARIQLLEAQLSFCNNEAVIGKHILSKICKNEASHPRLRSKALNLLGQCLVETNSDSISVLNYFYNSLKLLNDIENSEKGPEDNESVQDTYAKIALFADREYQTIMTHMKSDVFQKKMSNIQRLRDLAKQIHDQRKKKTDDEIKAAMFHQKQSNIDEMEIKNTRDEKNNHLYVALKYYAKYLTESDKQNMMIFRLISLFLENRDNSHITDVIKVYLPKIPSYKYITMLPQLIPHISDASGDLFSSHINRIVEKCAVDHPHHTLPLLLSLKNANKDRAYTNSKGRTPANDSKTLAAIKILKSLETKPEMHDLIHSMQQVAEAMIELAYYVNEDSKEKTINIPARLKISKIKNLNILVPSFHLDISRNNNYNNFPTILSFSTTYSLVGGINAPKLIYCKCSDGIQRPELIKGNDDLRQDAVMQQVFTIMNGFLTSNKQTENLRIRTYKIVPFSKRSGVLEWVENSMPVGEYLAGKDGNTGAHLKYRPKDMSASACRAKFKRGKDQTLEQKLAIFKDICKHFKPVFHKFFESSFPQPTVWYERCRAYIHSVATTSMCGYILGIGDRHVSNILMDKQTAEVIHIDFGIAFEQGRCLPTPETVPFRLTRDIVDGMGISGVDGLFRRSCEKTMEVLRKNSQTIITILEVLLYDPLYAWTVTASEANKRQTDDDLIRDLSDDAEEENKNLLAERALLRLRSKLQGTEDGKPTDIENQVGALIQQAMNPTNLCRLFYGWQPYL